MRKFIMSDIHGFGNVYYAMMNYIDDISKKEEVELYINGDLFDRGYESAEILLDVKRRIEENKYKIVYLGGNHELMMHEVFEKRRKGIRVSYFNDWYDNGGCVTDTGLSDTLKSIEEVDKVADFVSNLKIYHKFEEKINGKPIVLVHAACPDIIKDECDMRIKDNNSEVFDAVWMRKNDIHRTLFWYSIDPRENKIWNDKYFTIVGHTPVEDKYGFEYYKKHDCINIDGGCAAYVSGEFQFNHYPLVEVNDSYLSILTFNDNNEIEYGNYLTGDRIIPYTRSELKREREHLNKKLEMNELILNEDDVVVYKTKKLQK